jgi:hypothetical protein
MDEEAHKLEASLDTGLARQSKYLKVKTKS